MSTNSRAKKINLRLSYNSPVVLTYAGVCLVLVAVNWLTQGWFNANVMVCYGHPSLLDPMTYVRCITYFFGHSGWEHYASNMLLMLLVGPVVEEKYGSGNLAFMIMITGIASGIIHCIFFDGGIIGASGIVFMMIILSAFTNMKKGEVPLSLILVAAIYLGREIINAFTPDTVSQFGHIVGGLFGLFWGIYFYRTKFRSQI
ncbi:MAG: rhomboid family intramembrane serine protease [Oscillospiraceae bacterium]|nr:rhomboid family intramembrane serine protease [Oscillospiraceae bacterium]